MGACNGCLHGVVRQGHACRDSKGYCLVAGQKVSSPCSTKCFIFFGMVQNDRALDRPRRRRMASGRVVTCPEGWIALKRKPRNRALFALCYIGPPGKIEAGLGRQIMQCEGHGLIAWPCIGVAKCLVFNGFLLFLCQVKII